MGLKGLEDSHERLLLDNEDKIESGKKEEAELDEAPDMTPFIFNVGTFAVSNTTCMNFFKRQIIKHWDIVDHQ